MNSCPSNRRTRSQNDVLKMTLGQTQDGETDKFVLELLSQLPPSKELLQHYKVFYQTVSFVFKIYYFQEKLEKYEEEEGQLLARINACAELLDNGKRLEAEIFKNQVEIEGLKDDLEAVSIKLHEEKRLNLKLNAENDQLRIKDVESQRKISLLLKMCGKNESEIVDMIERSREVYQL